MRVHAPFSAPSVRGANALGPSSCRRGRGCCARAVLSDLFDRSPVDIVSDAGPDRPEVGRGPGQAEDRTVLDQRHPLAGRIGDEEAHPGAHDALHAVDEDRRGGAVARGGQAADAVRRRGDLVGRPGGAVEAADLGGKARLPRGAEDQPAVFSEDSVEVEVGKAGLAGPATSVHPAVPPWNRTPVGMVVFSIQLAASHMSPSWVPEIAEYS